MGGGVTLGTLGGRNPWLSSILPPYHTGCSVGFMDEQKYGRKKGLQNRWLGSLEKVLSQETKKCGWFVFGCCQCFKKTLWDQFFYKKVRPKKKNGVFEAWKFTGLVPPCISIHPNPSQRLWFHEAITTQHRAKNPPKRGPEQRFWSKI